MAKSEKGASSFVSDGHPSDSVHYREYKLILRPDRFTSHEALHEFSKLVRGAAKKEGVEVARAVGPDECLLRDLWQKKDVGVVEKGYTFRLAPHASGVYRVTGKR